MIIQIKIYDELLAEWLEEEFTTNVFQSIGINVISCNERIEIALYYCIFIHFLKNYYLFNKNILQNNVIFIIKFLEL